MIKEFKIFESKNVGILYHFTTLSNFYLMVEQDKPFLRPIKNYVTLWNSVICCTRNYNMKSKQLRSQKRECRITLDGNKLSEKYKIKSYFDKNYPDREEREERIFTNENVDIKKYCLRIDILDKPCPPDETDINYYNYDDIDDGYEYLKQRIIELTDLPIFFVDKMKPYNRLNENLFERKIEELIFDKTSYNQINENITEFDILPPKKLKKYGGGGYIYYAIFIEMYLPQKVVNLLSPTNKYPGSYVLKNIYENNPYLVGIYELKILPTYVDSKIINGQKYDKIILNDLLKSPVRLNEEKIKILHNDLIFNILDKMNTENINLKEIIKFDMFETFENPLIDEDIWENMK